MRGFIHIGLAAILVLWAQVAHAQSTVWEYDEQIDQLSDSTTHSAFTKHPDNGSFAILCDSEGVAALVVFERFGSTVVPEGPITYRIDNSEPVRSPWLHLNARKSVTTGDDAIALARHAARANTLVIQNNGRTLEFSLQGSHKAISKVAEHCPALSLITADGVLAGRSSLE